MTDKQCRIHYTFRCDNLKVKSYLCNNDALNFVEANHNTSFTEANTDTTINHCFVEVTN